MSTYKNLHNVSSNAVIPDVSLSGTNWSLLTKYVSVKWGQRHYVPPAVVCVVSQVCVLLNATMWCSLAQMSRLWAAAGQNLQPRYAPLTGTLTWDDETDWSLKPSSHAKCKRDMTLLHLSIGDTTICSATKAQCILGEWEELCLIPTVKSEPQLWPEKQWQLTFISLLFFFPAIAVNIRITIQHTIVIYHWFSL